MVKIILDVIVIGMVYFIGFSNGMRYSDSWWNSRLDEMIEEIKEDINNQSQV